MFRFLGIGFLGLSFLTGCAIDKEAIENRIASDKQKKSAIVKPLPQISQPMANGRRIKSVQDYKLGAEDDIKIGRAHV